MYIYGAVFIRMKFEILTSQITHGHTTHPWLVQPKKVGKFLQAIDDNKRVKVSLFALLSLTCSQYWDFPNSP